MLGNGRPGRLLVRGRPPAPTHRRESSPGLNVTPVQEVGSMIRRHWPALSIAMAVLAAGLNLQAQPPAAPAGPAAGADVTLKDVVARQQDLERRYKAFTTNLLAL